MGSTLSRVTHEILPLNLRSWIWLRHRLELWLCFTCSERSSCCQLPRAELGNLLATNAPPAAAASATVTPPTTAGAGALPIPAASNGRIRGRLASLAHLDCLAPIKEEALLCYSYSQYNLRCL